MMRLTKDDRTIILAKIIAFKLGQLKERLLTVISSQAFNAVVDYGIKAAGFSVGIFENAQEGLFPSWSGVRVGNEHEIYKEAFGGYRTIPTDYIRGADRVPSGKSRYVPHVINNHWHRDDFDTPVGAVPELDIFVDEAIAMEAEYQNIKREVMAVLNSVTTLKRLGEVWPECAQFFPEEIQRQRAKPPAIKTERVNSILGL